VIVIGASAGGLSPLKAIVHDLDPQLAAAVFIVRHIHPFVPCGLATVLGPDSSLPVSRAVHGLAPRRGQIYVAPPDRHLVFARGKMEVIYGTQVNFSRPCIDVTFRSAARAFGPRVIGVVLSGHLDDGTAGLLAIKRAGGVAVVQDPGEAEAESMPRSAVWYARPDHVLHGSAIGPALNALVRDAVAAASNPLEVTMPENIDNDPSAPIGKDIAGQERDERRGKPSVFTCPECGGVLWQLDDEGPPQFRCHIGHGCTGAHLSHQKAEIVEKSIWYVMRSLKELMLLSAELAAHARGAGNAAAGEHFEMQSRAAEFQLSRLEQELLRPHRDVGRE
jgi:two-component system chemotaxis response regulator CheB